MATTKRQVATRLKNFTPLLDELIPEMGLITTAVFGCAWRHTQMSRGVCDASHDTIAEILGLSKRAVRRSFQELVKKGYLKATYRKGQTTVYRDGGKASVQITLEGSADSQSAVPETPAPESMTADSQSAPPRTDSPPTADSQSTKETNKRQRTKTKEETTTTAPSAPAVAAGSLVSILVDKGWRGGEQSAQEWLKDKDPNHILNAIEALEQRKAAEPDAVGVFCAMLRPAVEQNWDLEELAKPSKRGRRGLTSAEIMALDLDPELGEESRKRYANAIP